MRDAYLEPWTGDYDRADLADAVRFATRLAKVGRALSWRRALIGVPPRRSRRGGMACRLADRAVRADLI
jgi:hypothetical protein